MKEMAHFLIFPLIKKNRLNRINQLAEDLVCLVY